MNPNCQKWNGQLHHLRAKHAEFRQAYADALQFAEENPTVKETSFTRCRELFYEIKLLILELKEDVNPAFKFKQLVNRLALSPDAEENKNLREKLLEMVSKENYEEAVATAKELDSNVKVFTHKEIIKNVLALGPEKLKKIATIMGKPSLIIVPDKSMTEIIDAMNKTRHYEGQDEAYCTKAHAYEWSGKPGKVSVSIVDMVQYPPVGPGKQGIREQQETCNKYFRDNDMRLISDSQYAAGMQKSLRAYEKAKKDGDTNPEKNILDFHEDSLKTVTIFNQNYNSITIQVHYGFFSQSNRKVFFIWNDPDLADPDGGDYDYRERGALQVM